MFSKNIYYSIIIRVLLLCLNSAALSYFVLKSNNEVAVLLGCSLLLLIVHFVYYLNKTNKKIAYFFEALKNNDSTLHFSESTKKSPTKELNAHLNRVNKIIQQIKLKNRAQDQYYKTIIEKAEIGLLTINNDNHILFANTAIKKLLNYDSLTHLQQIKRVDQPLFELLMPKKPFSNKIIELSNERETKLLTLNASHVKLNNQSLLLVLASDIKQELDNKEVESWVKLTKVLTHEIMNSIAPISSITETLHDNLKNNSELPNSEIIKDTVMGLKVIKEQTENLQDFVVSYRSFSGVSTPKKQLIAVDDLLKKIPALFKTEIEAAKIDFSLQLSKGNDQLFADENQISQVLFNLVKNAIESTPSGAVKKISISTFITEQNKIAIAISDNGIGISKEQIDEIFVPFFSTKKEGSGVGLSLSKHIMKMHKGSLTVHSVPCKKTTFTLIF